MWLRLPLRSLWRNRRRTLLSIAIIALGTAISLFVLGFMQEATQQIRTTSVEQFGNLQIAAPSLWEDTAEGYEYLIGPDGLARAEGLLAQSARVAGATPQLVFSGLIGTRSATQVVEATALVPGNATLDVNRFVVDGRGLESGDGAAVLVGRSLAEELGLALGDNVTFTVTTVGGAYNVRPLRVAGIYRFASSEVEKRTVFVPLAYGQFLLNTDGVDRLIVTLDRLDATERERTAIQARLNAEGFDLEVRTWEELSPIYRQLSGYFNALFGFLTLAVSVLVFFIILQVLTLSFLERTREVGTIRALGTTRGDVFRLFFAESAWLAFLGSLVGVGFGVALGLGFNAAGIAWLPPGTVEETTLAVLLSPTTALIPFLVSVTATLVSSVYPSIHAARLRVVDALRVT